MKRVPSKKNATSSATSRATTSLKLPRDLKQRIIRLLKDQPTSAHAFMVQAIEEKTNASERRVEFVREALLAKQQTLEGAPLYEADDVFAHLRAQANGEPAKGTRDAPPKGKKWRG